MSDHIQTPDEITDERARYQAGRLASGCGCLSVAGFCLAGFAVVATFDAGRPLGVSIAVVALIGVGATVAGAVAIYMAQGLKELARSASRDRDAGGWGSAALEVAVDMDVVASLVQLGFAKESAQQAIARERAERTVPSSADATALMKAVLARRV